jgi:hypothetical protein
MQLEEPVYSAELTAPLPVPTSGSSSSRNQAPGSAAAAAAAMGDDDLDSEVALKLDAACLRVFSCLAGVLERCVLLTGV